MKKVALLLLLASFTITAQQSATDSAFVPNPEKIYRTVETDTRPDLYGGMYTFSKYIGQHLTLPEIRNRKITVFVGFVVENDGQLTDVKFIHLSAEKLYDIASDSSNADLSFIEAPVYESLKQQSVQIISDFKGKWIPATISGIPVRCQYNYPIMINLE